MYIGSKARWQRVGIQKLKLGRGGDQVVSVHAFYSDDPSSNPADAYSFSVKIVFEKDRKINKERPGWPIFKQLKLFHFSFQKNVNNQIYLILSRDHTVMQSEVGQINATKPRKKFLH